MPKSMGNPADDLSQEIKNIPPHAKGFRVAHCVWRVRADNRPKIKGDARPVHTTSLTLLEKLRDPNDAASWERFIALYTPFLFYWARRLKVNGTEAEDLVQDVFVKLFEAMSKFEYDPEKGNFRGWLRTLCFHRWNDVRRKRGNNLKQAGPGDIDGLAAKDDGLEELWKREYEIFLIRQAMRLCDEYAHEFDATTLTAFREVMVNQRSIKEVAQELGLTENAVSLAKLRLLRRLRLDLAKFID